MIFSDLQGFRETALLGHLGVAPTPQIVSVQDKAEQVGGNEPQLRGFEPNDADDQTVRRCQHPAFPMPFADQQSRNHGKHTREVVEPQQRIHVASSAAFCAECRVSDVFSVAQIT